MGTDPSRENQRRKGIRDRMPHVKKKKTCKTGCFSHAGRGVAKRSKSIKIKKPEYPPNAVSRRRRCPSRGAPVGRRRLPHETKRHPITDASRMKRKKPAAPYSRTGESRTTLGEGALNFRVRNGNGCDNSSMATGKKPQAGC